MNKLPGLVYTLKPVGHTINFLRSLSGLLLFVLLALCSPSSVVAKEPATPSAQSTETVDSYVLFWPLSVGRTEGDNLYTLKLLKEKVSGYFVFGGTNKADYLVLLGAKRILEGEKLISDEKIEPAKKTISRAGTNFSKAYESIKSAESKGKFDSKKVRRDRLVNSKALIDKLKLNSPADLHQALDSTKDKAHRILSDYLP